MKVLFLDIDGVCNCHFTQQRHKSFIGIDPPMAARVKKIIVDTGCKVVLSSYWRLDEEDKREVISKVCQIIDVTPSLTDHFRGDEVNAWLKEHPEVTKYAILDDSSDFHKDQPLFKTEWTVGLTDEIAQAVTEYLNK